MTISKAIGILSITLITCCILLSVLISTLYKTSLDKSTAFEQERILNILATELSVSSEELTRLVRFYVVTGQEQAELDYISVLNERNGQIPRKLTRAIAPSDTISLIELMRRYGAIEEEIAKVNLASQLSNELVSLEEEAINAVKGLFKDSAGKYTIKKKPDVDYAVKLVFSDAYTTSLSKIQKPLNEFFIMLRTRKQNETIEVSEVVYYNILLLGFTIGAVFLLTLLFVWYVRYRICLPLAQMADDVKRGNKGSLKEQLFFGNKNEIIILEQAVSDRVDIESRLRETQFDLEKNVIAANLANNSKSLFLARMSHEIRTPMNSIIGMSSIAKRKLNESYFDKEEIQEHVQQIEISSQHLLGLLNDILDISKIESGKIELSSDDFHLPNLINNVAAIIKPRCIEKNINFSLHIIGLKHNGFTSDSLRLRQILINLLGNAVKFTGSDGSIDFIVTQKDSRLGLTQIEFSVKDTGIGILKNDLEKLFKPFAQGNAQISKDYGGTGLGLSISQSIAGMMGSEIVVDSTPKFGSTFSFTVWLEKCELQIEEVTITQSVDILKNKRVLLVDDVDINRIIVIEMLIDTGIEMEEAPDGSIGLKMFEESAPGYYDFILMDIQMPIMNGYLATVNIRKSDHPDSKSIPIVAMTANAFKEDIEKSLRSGMNDHLSKPLIQEKLVDVLVKLIGK